MHACNFNYTRYQNNSIAWRIFCFLRLPAVATLLSTSPVAIVDTDFRNADASLLSFLCNRFAWRLFPSFLAYCKRSLFLWFPNYEIMNPIEIFYE